MSGAGAGQRCAAAQVDQANSGSGEQEGAGQGSAASGGPAADAKESRIGAEAGAGSAASRSPPRSSPEAQSATPPTLRTPMKGHAAGHNGPEPMPLNADEAALVDETISDLLRATAAKRVADVEHNLNIDTVLFISTRVEAFFLFEPALLHLKAPINIVGDVHGQFLDLLRFLEAGGYPPESQYLFLGDYVDRGRMGMEVSILLFAFKLRYPDRVFLLRGNHECSQISRTYGFHDECKSKYDIACWKAVNQVFRCLPLAAIVSDRIFATHGGLSPDLRSLDDINRIRRPCDVPVEGLLCDLLWSDPSPDVETWSVSDRGVSYLFGDRALEVFMDTYQFDLFVRAHQVVEEGFEFFNDSRKLVTVFSAANYCATFDNAGAMLIVDENLVCSFHVIKPLVASAVREGQDFVGRPQTPRPD